jgi:peptide chain release factor subunit 3
LLELLSYKPVFTRGYSCIFHMHTLAEDCTIKDIMTAQEADQAKGETVTKEKPKFIRSFAKARVRIQFKVPISLEKFSVLPALGQFTLRDEGKTIALGTVVRYKPASAA